MIGPGLAQSSIHATLPQPQCTKGVYRAPWEGGDISKGTLDVLKWKASATPPKFPTPAQAAELAPSTAVNHTTLKAPSDGQLRATWLGHASYLVQAEGVNILTDPVWSDRASPVQCLGPKRYVPPPCPLKDLPAIDVVTISHNHYDHLDHATVVELEQLFAPLFVVPLGMRQWFAKLGWAEAAMQRVVELSWWACHLVDVRGATVAVTGVPVQHWAMRNGFDRNTQLWGGFVMEVRRGDGRVMRAAHLGDTGAAPVFDDIGRVFSPIDVALVPIGAYEPRWFMHNQHIDPKQAVEIHTAIGARLSLGMHWGTFILTDEPLDEPPKLLAQCLVDAGLSPTAFRAPKHGETVQVPLE